MSSYNPPIFNNAIFNTEDFNEANPTEMSIDYADTHYLKFPLAQGNETFQDKSVIFSESTTNKSTKLYQSTNNLIIDPQTNSSNIILKARNSTGSDTSVFQVDSNLCTINTATGLQIQGNESIILSGYYQNTTYTGWVGNGANTYTNPSITISDGGKITAISSGTSSSTSASYFGSVTSAPSPTLSMTISNYNSWDINDFFTARISFVQDYGTLNVVGIYPSNASISGYVNIYPKRLVANYCNLLSIGWANVDNVITQTSTPTYSSDFGYSNTNVGQPGYAPNGRATWFYNGQVGTTSNFYVGVNTAGTMYFTIYNPSAPSTPTYCLNMYMEIIDKGNAPSGTTITTTGFNKSNISVSY